MTRISLLLRPTRNSNIAAIVFFHTLHQRPPCGYNQVSHDSVPNNWFVKLVASIFSHSRYSDTCFDYLRVHLTPEIAFEVTNRWFSFDPKLGFRFLEFSGVELGMVHCFKTYDVLMKSLCRMGLHDLAKRVFDCMRRDGHVVDGSVLGFLLESSVDACRVDLVKKLLEEVDPKEVRMSEYVYNVVLNMLVTRNQVDEAIALFRKHFSLHSSPDTWTLNILIRGLCRGRRIDEAFRLLNEMESFGCFPDIVTCNTLITGMCRSNEIERACHLLKDLSLRYHVMPDVVTYTSVITGCCKLGKMQDAQLHLEEMINIRIRPNLVTFNVLIDGFGKAGKISSALKMYEKMHVYGCQPDVVTFTSLIDGHCRAGQLNDCLKFWHEMTARNILLNAYAFSVIINALCKSNRLNDAHDVLRQLRWTDIVPKPFIYNPVIDGYCKAGNVDEANQIAAEMEEKGCQHDKVTFTILIIGHCMKGRMMEAMSIYKKMLAVGCGPDNITVSSFTSCLLKAGMVDEAFRIRQSAPEDMNLNLSSSKKSIFERRNSDILVAV